MHYSVSVYTVMSKCMYSVSVHCDVAMHYSVCIHCDVAMHYSVSVHWDVSIYSMCEILYIRDSPTLYNKIMSNLY